MDSAELRKVTWIDSATVNGWHFVDNTKFGPVKATTVGFVIAECDESVTLAGTVVFKDQGQICDAITIPRVAILNSKVLSKR